MAVPVVSGFGDGLDATGQATAITTATGGVLLPSATPGDVSEPGKNDTVRLVIAGGPDGGGVAVSGNLQSGNQQAH